jgi:hypothetical protein
MTTTINEDEDLQQLATEDTGTFSHHEDSDEEEEENGSDKNKRVKYRQYLIDRTNGQSKLGTSKPPCSVCYVPLPVVWFADLIEQNRVFECLGRCGIFDASNLRARKICIGIGLGCNILGLLLSVYTCLAISKNHDVIRISSFSSGTIIFRDETYPDYYHIRVGMRAIAVETVGNPNSGEYDYSARQAEIFFDESLCDIPGTGIPLVSQEGCKACGVVSSKMIFTLLVSLFMCVPSITTDVLRLYPHYDCNCQKVFAGFAAFISVAFALYTLLLYQFQCFYGFGSGFPLCVNADGDYFESINVCPEGYISAVRLYHAGPGWCALAAAVVLKIFDMLVNLAIPTPLICRDRDEQRQYEQLLSSQQIQPGASNDGNAPEG